MAIIFFHDAEQEKIAQESKTAVEENLNNKVYTEIVSFSKFYLAEDYHQKYYLQGDPVLSGEMRAYYPDFERFVDSTTAARLNAYLGGYGTAEQLSEELDSYGLSERGKKVLQTLVHR